MFQELIIIIQSILYSDNNLQLEIINLIQNIINNLTLEYLNYSRFKFFF